MGREYQDNRLGRPHRGSQGVAGEFDLTSSYRSSPRMRGSSARRRPKAVDIVDDLLCSEIKAVRPPAGHFALDPRLRGDERSQGRHGWFGRHAARFGRRSAFAGSIAKLALALGLVALLGSPVRAEDAPSATVTGAAARDRVIGNTLDGTTADGPYTLFVAADGHLVSTDRDGRVDGTWAFRDGKLCTSLPDEDEECRALEVSGQAGAFVDADGSRYPFTISPGDPKGL